MLGSRIVSFVIFALVFGHDTDRNRLVEDSRRSGASLALELGAFKGQVYQLGRLRRALGANRTRGRHKQPKVGCGLFAEQFSVHQRKFREVVRFKAIHRAWWRRLRRLGDSGLEIVESARLGKLRGFHVQRRFYIRSRFRRVRSRRVVVVLDAVLFRTATLRDAQKCGRAYKPDLQVRAWTVHLDPDRDNWKSGVSGFYSRLVYSKVVYS